MQTTASEEFAEQILADLSAQGLSGEELLASFNKKQAQIRPAVEAMIAEAEAATAGDSVYESYDDVFDSEDGYTGKLL